MYDDPMKSTHLTSSRDTHPDAEAVQIELLRSASVSRRLALMRALSADVITRSRRAIRRRHPDESELEIRLRFVALHYGDELARRVRDDLARRARS